MNRTNLIRSSTLSQIARRAISNAQSLLKFEKDRPAVYRDCLHDQRELAETGPMGRLRDVTRLLLRATELAAVGEELSAQARVSLGGLCDWVEIELAWQRAMV